MNAPLNMQGKAPHVPGDERYLAPEIQELAARIGESESLRKGLEAAHGVLAKQLEAAGFVCHVAMAFSQEFVRLLGQFSARTISQWRMSGCETSFHVALDVTVHTEKSMRGQVRLVLRIWDNRLQGEEPGVLHNCSYIGAEVLAARSEFVSADAWKAYVTAGLNKVNPTGCSSLINRGFGHLEDVTTP
jgi:hypothetical protein